MPIEIILFIVLAIQIIILGLIFFRKKENQEKVFLQTELARMSRELAQALGEARKESNENLTQQFRMVFDNQRAGSKDQNEALRAFGEVVRKSVRVRRQRWDEGVGYLERETFDAFLQLPAPQRKLIREVILTFAKVHQGGAAPRDASAGKTVSD